MQTWQSCDFVGGEVEKCQILPTREAGRTVAGGCATFPDIMHNGPTQRYGYHHHDKYPLATWS